MLREPSRSSGHKFVQRCVLLTFSCCQSQSMFLTSHQSQSMFLTSCQPQSMFVTSCQPQSVFVTVAAGPLTQVSRAMSNASFERPPTMRHPALLIHSCISFWAKCFVLISAGFSIPVTSTIVALPLVPKRLGYGDVLLVLLRALRQLPSTLSRPLAHVALPPSPCLLSLPPLPELSTRS